MFGLHYKNVLSEHSHKYSAIIEACPQEDIFETLA